MELEQKGYHIVAAKPSGSAHFPENSLAVFFPTSPEARETLTRILLGRLTMGPPIVPAYRENVQRVLATLT